MLLAALVLVPFLGKPFTIDDVTFLLQARHILTDPMHPAAFDMVFDGERIRVSRELATGPVMGYLLVPVIQLTKAEFVAHSIQFALLVAGCVGVVALSARLGLDHEQARLAALLCVVSPAVLAMTSTAMPDVPAMAFGTWGVERYVVWRHQRSVTGGLAAVLLLTIATLSRSHAIMLIPVAAILALASHEYRGIAREIIALFPLIAAALLVASVIFVTRDPVAGEDLAAATASRIEPIALLRNVPSFALHLVLAFPLAIGWVLVRGSEFLVLSRTFLSLCIALVLGVVGGQLGMGLLWGVAFLLIATLSVDVLIDIAIDAIKRRDRMQMALLLWIFAPTVAAVYIQFPAKLLIFSAPAMGIIVARRKTSRDVALNSPGLRLVVAMCLALSLLILRADRAMADIGRSAAAVVASQVRQGNRTWADGAWGFQWYAMNAGAEPLARSAPFPEPGDIVVTSLQGGLLRRLFPSATLVYRQVYATPGGRIHGGLAGFYTNVVGPLPWAWGRGEIGRIEVWRIEPAT